MPQRGPKPHKPDDHCCTLARRVFCIRYDACQQIAQRKQWDDFSCDGCEAYEPEQWNPKLRGDDNVRSLKRAWLAAGSSSDPAAFGPSPADLPREMVP